ncbi:MAG: purine-binding chemotaxis protein CheW [Melioribacteraceae bacterium]|nr:purine-binding chemotaxis protein CheW [Melioribacteraceae bacterium]
MEDKEEIVEEKIITQEAAKPIEDIKTIPLKDIPIHKDENRADKNDSLHAVENAQLKSAEENVELENIVHVIGFIIGKECYGIEIKDIQEIIRMVDITKVPNVPYFIEGVINLRGKVLPVVNLRSKVNMEKIEFNSKTRIIVLEKENTTLGFIVDAIKEVIRIPENQLEPPPAIAVGDTSDYIRAVAKTDDGMVILLNSNRLLER